MVRFIKIDNYIIDTPIIEILHQLQSILTNGKLRDIKMHTDDIVVSCPHHADGLEANPDCNIYIGENKDIPYGFARCFACEFQGTFDRFVAECFDSSVEYAKQWLIKNYGEQYKEKICLGDDICLNKKTVVKKLDPTILDQYQPWTPYLQKRHLSRQTCEALNIKYDPYYRCCIFPCYDAAGNLVMLPKRNIDTKIFYLDKNQDKPLYCIDKIVKNNLTKFMIVEGPIDCATCYEHGVPAIATLGAVSSTQINQLNKLGIRVLYLCFDNDEAGEKFKQTVKAGLNKNILTVDVTLPKGRKDVNDLTEEEWEELILKFNLPKFDF